MNTETKTSEVQKKKPAKTAREIEQDKVFWLRQHRGIFSEIARRPGIAVSESYVRQVFWAPSEEWKSTHATSKRPLVESALKAAGAPI